MTKQIFSAIKVTLLALVLSFGLSYVYAWTAPTQQPPAGNVSAPINTSLSDQIKAGDICTTKGGSTKCLSSAAGDNLGNHTATQDINLGANKLIGNGSNTTYGTLTVQGEKNTWPGINFKRADGTNAGTLMLRSDYFGVYNSTDNAWNMLVTTAGGTGGWGNGNVYANDYYSYAAGKWMSQLAATSGGLGVGQSWVNIGGVAGLRSYSRTNNTGKPIMVFATGIGFSTWSYMSAYVGGVYIGHTSDYDTGSIQFIVPDGSTYQVVIGGYLGGPDGGGRISNIAELR